MATTWYKRKWVIVSLHTAVWTLLFLLPILLSQSVQHSHKEHAEVDRSLFIYLSICTNTLWVALFYLNAGVLIPKFVYKKKIAYYVLIQLLITAGLISFNWLFLN